MDIVADRKYFSNTHGIAHETGRVKVPLCQYVNNSMPSCVSGSFEISPRFQDVTDTIYVTDPTVCDRITLRS